MMSSRFLFAAAAALLLGACATAPEPSPVSTVASDVPAPVHKVLLVSIDGLRADALDRGITPNLSRIANNGVRAMWMTPSYPSLTFPNHYTIVTGLRPDHHGIVHNTMHDKKLGDFSLGNREAVGDGRWWGGQPIWVGAEKAGIPTATWSWPGSEAAIDGVRPSTWRPYDGSVPANARVDTVLGWLDQTGPQAPRFVTLYFDQVDHAGHAHGPNSKQYTQAIANVDAAMGRLLNGLKRSGRLASTDIIVVSDHGMAEVAPGHIVPLEKMAPADLVKVVTSGQVVELAPLRGKRTRANAAILGRHDHYQCWRKQELPERWHYGSNKRIPPIVCQVDEGWDALPADVAAKRSTTASRGSHGYTPDLPSMRAVFLASGPSFVNGLMLPPFDNVDVYPMLARLLGIRPAKNDGNPATLLRALRPAARTSKQAALTSRGDSAHSQN